MTIWWKWLRNKWFIAIPLLIINFAVLFGDYWGKLKIYNCVVQCTLSQVNPLSFLVSVGKRFGQCGFVPTKEHWACEIGRTAPTSDRLAVDSGTCRQECGADNSAVKPRDAMSSRPSNALVPISIERNEPEQPLRKPEPPRPPTLNLDGCDEAIPKYLYLCGALADPKLDGLGRVIALAGGVMGAMISLPLSMFYAAIGIMSAGIMSAVSAVEVLVLLASFGLALPLALEGNIIFRSLVFLIVGTLFAIALKYILIFLTYILGAALGMLVFINSVLGAVGAVLVHCLNFYKEARETAAGMKEAAEVAKNIHP